MDLLKKSNITPVFFFKKDNQDYNNYRPVSLILNLNKLIKKLVHKRLYNFLEKHSFLFEKQYGFCSKIFTNHALSDITKKILEACDKDNFACVVYVDFKKAFDTVNHNTLFQTSNHHGIRETESIWHIITRCNSTAHKIY